MWNSRDREERIEIFEDTERWIRSNAKLQAAVAGSAARQVFYPEEQEIRVIKSYANTDSEREGSVRVSRDRSFQAAEKYVRNGDRTLVLNFASSTNPGGGVKGGSAAQEESLCRCSTLYDCLSVQKMREAFYQRHKDAHRMGQMNALHNDDCIYTPDVYVIKSDIEKPQRLPERDWYKADVITCAAPNLRERPSNRMNPGDGTEKVEITDAALKDLHKKRLVRILDLAYLNHADVVILGAFGCGAFRNPPEIVSAAARETLSEYRKRFRMVEFAVFCKERDSSKYDVFRKALEVF